MKECPQYLLNCTAGSFEVDSYNLKSENDIFSTYQSIYVHVYNEYKLIPKTEGSSLVRGD